MDNLEMLLLMGGFALFIFSVISIGLYILFAVGLYGMAKTEGIENGWLAFIPIVQLYIIGRILREVRIGNYTVPMLEYVLPLLPIAVVIADEILGVIPVLGSLLSILLNVAFMIFMYIVIYQLYKRYRGEKAGLMLVLSIIFFFMAPIYIFTMRNSHPIN